MVKEKAGATDIGVRVIPAGAEAMMVVAKEVRVRVEAAMKVAEAMEVA